MEEHQETIVRRILEIAGGLSTNDLSVINESRRILQEVLWLREVLWPREEYRTPLGYQTNDLQSSYSLMPRFLF